MNNETISEESIEEFTCMICLELLDDNLPKRDLKSTKKLMCNHKFHKKCIQKWFNEKYNNYHRTCPICRQEHNYILTTSEINDYQQNTNFYRQRVISIIEVYITLLIIKDTKQIILTLLQKFSKYVNYWISRLFTFIIYLVM